MKNFIKVLSLVAVGAVASTAANAQVVYPYVVDFETANTTPSNKSYASTDTIVANGVKWVMPGVFLGNPVSGSPSPDFFNGARSARVRLDDNANGAPGYLVMAQDLQLGADSLTFWTGMYGSDIGDSIKIDYSTNQGGTWTPLTTVAITGTNIAGQYVALKPNITAPVRFKFTKVRTTNLRFNIDDIRVTAAAQASNIFMTAKSPEGVINSSVDAMTLTFNEDVVVGTGNLTLNEVGGTPVVYDVTTSSDITIANNIVTIANVALAADKDYYVTYDSTAFESGTGLLSAGIYDSTTWTFSTLPASMGAFVENFDNCVGGVMGLFSQNSVTGTATFYCNTYNDTTANFNPPYATINGGTGSASMLNEDYLVTTVPVDLSEMDVKTVNLYYAEKRRFGGNGVKRGIYYSQDYAGNAATATWVAIDDDLAMPSPTGTFIRRNDNITTKIDITQPFYLAFKYESIEDVDSGRNWEWSLDDIELEVIENDSTISINPIAKNNINVAVLGFAKANEVNVRVATIENLEAQVSIYDINGRKLFTQAANLRAGTQVLNLNNTSLNTGMYILKLDSNKGSRAVKFIVE